MYISCQSRDGNIDDFFTYENQPYPPSISDLGELKSGTKSDLVNCLEHEVDDPSTAIPDAQAKVIDGAVLVQMLEGKAGTTFCHYAEDVFIPAINKELQSVQRVDIVWDVYVENSLKLGTREK